MIHPHTELRFISEAIGYGIFATKLIPKGTVVWTMCDLDRQITSEQAEKFDAIHHRYLLDYSYVDVNGHLIFCWDHGRYINHSCNPTNIDMSTADISIARRDIAPGEQITCDYGLYNILADLKCWCGEEECRGIIRGNDLLTLDESLQKQVQDILPLVAKIDQPLFPFIREKEQFKAYINGNKPLPSHKSFLCPDPLKNKLIKIFESSL